MPTGLFSRIRWGNVARVGAVLALLALLLAWPRLTPEPPVVPESGVEEVTAPAVAGPTARPAEPPAARAVPPAAPREEPVRARRLPRRSRVPPRGRRRAPKEVVRPAVVPHVTTTPLPPRRYVPPPRPRPRTHEFSPEG